MTAQGAARLAGAQVASGGVEVTLAVGGRLHRELLDALWLQDHGEDPARLDQSTLQRKVDTFAIDPTVRAVAARVEGDDLVVEWSDGVPAGRWSAALLAGTLGLGPAPAPRRTWAAGSLPEPLPRHDHDAVIGTDAGLAAWLDDVATLGFGLVRGVPPTAEAAEGLARRVAYPRETIFGGMWRLSSEMTDHSDTAYSQTFLEPHTDATYVPDAPGLQMFCCLERDGSGGESILVDGLAAAYDLRATDPAAFATLTRVVVPGRYVEKGVHLRAERPAIRLDARGEVVQVSINNYDRAPFRLPEPEMREFYRAYGALHRRLNDRSHWLLVRLDAGDALIFDNWRTLHGRMAYTGRRVFMGCYHNREDFDSRRRVLRA
jgi:hypothetical protein